MYAWILLFFACGHKSVPELMDNAGQEEGGVPTTLATPADGTPIDHAERGTLDLCPRGPILPPLTRPDSPWIEGDSVIIAKTPSVEGSVNWNSEFDMFETDTERRLVGNGLPNHPTGTFPVQEGTVAYTYYSALPAEGYNSAAEIPIAAYEIDITLPLNPEVQEEPTCVSSIFTGVVSQTGAAWHADVAFDSSNHLLDPVAALPMDSCWGHPYMEQYHYHGYSWKCFPDQGEPGEHSPLFGYAIDGFGVFGPLGEDGTMVSNDDLDECHGHTHTIEWDGELKEMYHYHVNNEYPYSICCFRGTPIELPEHLQH
jgi:hypothetical protein